MQFVVLEQPLPCTLERAPHNGANAQTPQSVLLEPLYLDNKIKCYMPYKFCQDAGTELNNCFIEEIRKIL
jgi:hypothetical protein